MGTAGHDKRGTVLFRVPASHGGTVSFRQLETEAPRSGTDTYWETDGESSEWDKVFAGLLDVSTPMVVTSPDELGPVWWVDGKNDVSGIVTLSYALGVMDPEFRPEAIRVHLHSLAELVIHERDAQQLASDDDRDPSELFDLIRCASCLTDPDLHAETLAAAVLDRTRELVDALSSFGIKVTVADDDPF